MLTIQEDYAADDDIYLSDFKKKNQNLSLQNQNV